MSSIGVWLDALAAWFKSWRSAKAGAELRAGEQAAKDTDAAAAEIAAEAAKRNGQ